MEMAAISQICFKCNVDFCSIKIVANNFTNMHSSKAQWDNFIKSENEIKQKIEFFLFNEIFEIQ